MKAALATVGLAVALALSACGSGHSTAKVCETIGGKRVCSKPGCVTYLINGRQLCGSTAIAYCRAIERAYKEGVELSPQQTKEAYRECLRIGVALNRQ